MAAMRLPMSLDLRALALVTEYSSDSCAAVPLPE